MNQIVLITGASSGIGKASAFLFAEKGYHLILTGRRAERLNEIKSQIESTYTNSKVLALPFDIQNFEDTRSAVESLPEDWEKIDILINNAGLAAGFSNVQDGDIEDWERMIDTNIKGLLYITRLIAPMMIKRGNGHIINVSSIAGKETYPMGNVYCATKHAVQSLTKGMRIDMLPHGIKVSSVSPGAVETEFSIVRFAGDEEKAKKVYDGFVPLRPEDVAESICFIASRPAHVNIDDILIMPAAQAYSRDFNRNSK